MRRLIALSAVVLLGSAGFARGEDCPAPLGVKLLTRWQAASGCYQFCNEPRGASAKVEHLRKAAEHLRAAGLEGEAHRIAEQARREERRFDERLLARKLAELKRLEAEVNQLRQVLARSSAAPAGQPRHRHEIEQLRSATPREPQVEIRLKVLEIARDKLQALGIKFAGAECPQCRDKAIRTVKFESECEQCRRQSKAEACPIATVVSDAEALAQRIAELRGKKLIKILSAPVLRTLSGQPARVTCGGEVPIPVPGDDGRLRIEVRPCGFHLDAVPTVLKDGRLRLELVPEITQCDFTHSIMVNGVDVPGLTTRRINAQVEITSGQTIALGHLASSQGKEGERALVILVTAETVEEPAPTPAARPRHAAPEPLVLPAPPLPVAPDRTR